MRGQQRIINSTLASEGWIAGWLQGIEKPGIIPASGRVSPKYIEIHAEYIGIHVEYIGIPY